MILQLNKLMLKGKSSEENPNVPYHSAQEALNYLARLGPEAAMRMLMNNLDPDVAERPEDLDVYGGIGKAARNWDAYDRI